ncbi:hypothetical protein HMPREF1214_01926 [Bacteroides sp. HPS0048]|jgi:hypothetical protein|nr:hypothetical protein HMPREF1214_01926 [Bacteroides sp. HPS0048]
MDYYLSAAPLSLYRYSSVGDIVYRQPKENDEGKL